MNEWKAFPFPVPSLASGVANKILAPLAALVCVAFEKALARRGHDVSASRPAAAEVKPRLNSPDLKCVPGTLYDHNQSVTQKHTRNE